MSRRSINLKRLWLQRFVAAAILLCAPLVGASDTKGITDKTGTAEEASGKLAARHGGRAVEVEDETECCPKTVRLKIDEDGASGELFLSGRVEELHRLVLVTSDRVVLVGELPRGGFNLLIGNLATRQQEKSIWAYAYGISPSGRFLAYETYYPRMVAPKARRSIYLLYDLSRPPSANRSGPETEWPEPNLGRPVFPKENVEEETWSIFAADEAYSINSPFLWSEDETRLVFLVGSDLSSTVGATCHIVSVHLGQNGRVEEVRETKLSKENVETPFLKPAYELEPERPLCLIADSLEWAEEGMYDEVVAEPGPASNLGRKVWIQVP